MHVHVEHITGCCSEKVWGKTTLNNLPLPLLLSWIAHFLICLCECHQCFIMSEQGVSIFAKSCPRSQILMKLLVPVLLRGWLLILHSVFQSQIHCRVKSWRWKHRRREKNRIYLSWGNHTYLASYYCVFSHTCLWIIDNPCTLKLFCLLLSLYYIYTGTSMLCPFYVLYLDNFFI